MILNSLVRDWVRRSVLQVFDFEDDSRRFYVVRVPEQTPRSIVLALNEWLNDEFESAFIVARESVTVEDITERVTDRLAEKVTASSGGDDADAPLVGYG